MSKLDEALTRLARTGPEYGAGLSNHGPMVAEALVRLGAADLVPAWVTGYLPDLNAPPGSGGRLAGWREALGDMRRLPDWTRHFTEELAGAPWREVLATWWPRLTPGMAAGATHGVIRTAHAVRSLAESESGPRRTELAHALAYWAAGYAEVPGRGPGTGVLSADRALAALPALDVEPRSLIVEHLGNLRDVPEFPAAVGALRPPGDVRADLAELVRVFARRFLTHGRHQPITLIHTVTAPAAVASVLEELPRSLWRPTYDALWQVGAALVSGYSRGAVPEPVPDTEPDSPAELARRAAETGEAHAIKMTEASLRAHAATGDPLFLHAAGRAVELLHR
ncbi:questin oxidase family protein [Sinosporangium siamense]|uniref:DUF4243 domain-containing protein n=1 Tax=Sinosporangium siamense TaxID=1367973 RepID=A0A919RPR2_9ACTN|nr:questin oxidase family protein [Sinosporangium siamense]GII97478.1 hypothetical protein Ssi02_77090 [Sinosporangium siamense]